MKAIVLLVASACLINGLAAYSVNFPLGDETFDFDESEKALDTDDELNIFFPDSHVSENMIVPFPTDDPTEVTTKPTWRPTWRPTTTTGRPTTTTGRPRPTWRPTTTTGRPTTTTRRPRPTWRPTWRPTTGRPTTSRPARRNPQIYNNAVRSLGPFAGRLTNVVLNRQGAQKTAQENEVVYNLNSIRRRTLSGNAEQIEN